MGLNNRPKWIIATAAALAATSVGGVALANAGNSDTPLPDSLKLRDAVPVATQASPRAIEATTSEALFDVRNAPIVRAQDGSFTLATSTMDTANTLDDADTLNTSGTLDTTDTSHDGAGSGSAIDSSGPGSGGVDVVDTSNTPNTPDTPAAIDDLDTVDTSNTLDTAGTNTLQTSDDDNSGSGSGDDDGDNSGSGSGDDGGDDNSGSGSGSDD